jgi:hypothetical protein
LEKGHIDTSETALPPAAGHGWMRRLFSLASHPLVLIAVGAVISGILVPSFTRGAQDHRQALEIKSGLVRSMSEAASPFLAATLANVLVYNGDVPRSYDVAYQRWIAKSSDVSTRLQTYVPDLRGYQGDAPGWSTLSLRMRDLYYYFRISPTANSFTRDDYTRRLQGFLAASPLCSIQCPNVDFKGLDRWLRRPHRAFDDSVNYYIEELLQAFRVALNDIVDSVLDANVRL